MRILALDLGKFKSGACAYDTADAGHRFATLPTTPQAMYDLLVLRRPDRSLRLRDEKAQGLSGSRR